MISANDLRAGNVYEYDGSHWMVLDIMLNKTAMRKMVVKVKSKNIKTGAITDITFNGGEKVEIVHLDKRPMQYLYDDGDGLVFMNMETFEQISITKERLAWELNFLKENATVDITSLNGEIIGIALPTKVALQIVNTEPAVRGDTVNKAMKDAELETGYHVRVPLFIESGETIVVRTDTGEYDGRAN